MLSVRPFRRWLTVFIPVILALVWAQAALAAAPTLLSLSPSSVASGSPAFTLTINGTDFTPGSTAKWGATALTTVYTSDTGLTAVVPANLITRAGLVSITVIAAGGDSSGAAFTIISSKRTAPRPDPAVAPVNEASVPASPVDAASVAAPQDPPPVNPPSSTTSNDTPAPSMAGGMAAPASASAANFKVNAVSGASNSAPFTIIALTARHSAFNCA